MRSTRSTKNSQLASILQQIRRGSFSDYANSLFSKGILEPRARVELATCRLRIGCSTTELPRHRIETKGVSLCVAARNPKPSSNLHRSAKCFSTLAMASRKSVESTMLYRSKVDSVRCPEI